MLRPGSEPLGKSATCRGVFFLRLAHVGWRWVDFRWPRAQFWAQSGKVSGLKVSGFHVARTRFAYAGCEQRDRLALAKGTKATRETSGQDLRSLPCPLAFLRAQNRAVDGQETRTGPLAEDIRLRNRCRREPRIPGQRWCRRCRTAAQRDRRARLRVKRREQSHAVVAPSPRLAAAAVKQNRRAS
jgi:hypothetical protein